MKNFYAIFFYFLMLLGQQNHAMAEGELSCKEIAKQIRILTYQLEETERSWISRKIPNEDNNYLKVPAEIAWKSLAIYDSWGSVPSSGLVYASHYPINGVYFFLSDKGLAGDEVQFFYKAASLVTMTTIFPLGVAINLVSYSAAFTYNEILKKPKQYNLDKLKKQYKEEC